MRIFALICLANITKNSVNITFIILRKNLPFWKIVAFCSSQNSASFLLPFKKFLFSKNVKFCKKNFAFLVLWKCLQFFARLMHFLFSQNSASFFLSQNLFSRKKLLNFYIQKFQIIGLRRIQYKKPILVEHTLNIYIIMIQRIIVYDQLKLI